MLLHRLLALSLAVGALGLHAQPASVAEPEISGHQPPSLLTNAELEDLLAPIALHPDALIALILPAATYPSDVVLAARRLNRDANPATLDREAWDDSVRALARYPEIIKWMDENLEWTKQVGEAFMAQPADVMNAVQRLRNQARAAGTLVDTPQQQVVVTEEVIRIVPAQPDVIYVPRYDPTVVYVSRPWHPHPASFFSFSLGYPVGYWLAYDFDWHRRTVWIVPPPHRVRYWHDRRDWRHPHYRRPGERDHHWHVWRPRPDHPHLRPGYRGPGDGRDGRGRRDVAQPGRPDRPPHWQSGGDRQGYRPPHLRREGTRPPSSDGAPRWQDRNRGPGGDADRRPWVERQRERQGEPGGPGRDGRGRAGGDGRDRRFERAGTPGGPTPDVAAPVGPVVPVAPTVTTPPPAPQLQPPPTRQPAPPQFSPNGRRLPDPNHRTDDAPRERSPNGRVLPTQQVHRPAPAVDRPQAERVERSRGAGGSGSGGRAETRRERGPRGSDGNESLRGHIE
jgi:hypothetical protein